MTLTLIAGVADNGVIGGAGSIPWHLPEDFKHFKRTTLGNTLVMGRGTFESIGRVLPGRATIVVTRDPDWAFDGVVVCHGVPEALERAGELPGETFSAGGGQIYRETMPLADRLVISHVHLEPVGDVFFPEIDPAVWREFSREPREGFDIAVYERI